MLAVAILGHWLRPMDLDTERAAARAAGLPLTPADMPLPHYPPGQDAAPIWRTLRPLFARRGVSPSWQALERAEVHGVPPVSSNPDLFRVIAEERDTLRLIHAAASKTGRSVHRGWGPYVLYADLAYMREASSLLRLENLAMARRGHPEEAIRNQRPSLRLANQASEDAGCIGYMAGIAIENESLSGMGDVLREYPTPQVIAAVRASVPRDRPRYDLGRALKAEALNGMATIALADSPYSAGKLLISSGYENPVLVRRRSGLMRALFQDPNEAVFLHFLTRQVKAAALPPNQRAAAMRAISRDARFTLSKGPSFLFASQELPPLGAEYDREMRILALRAALLAGADVLAYRAAHGRFPNTLGEASPNAIDPFIQKPLGYRRTAKGFVVYSAGPDGHFNGLPGAGARGQAYFSYPNGSLDP
jgi:hypothetical protein